MTPDSLPCRLRTLEKPSEKLKSQSNFEEGQETNKNTGLEAERPEGPGASQGSSPVAPRVFRNDPGDSVTLAVIQPLAGQAG